MIGQLIGVVIAIVEVGILVAFIGGGVGWVWEEMRDEWGFGLAVRIIVGIPVGLIGGSLGYGVYTTIAPGGVA